MSFSVVGLGNFPQDFPSYMALDILLNMRCELGTFKVDIRGFKFAEYGATFIHFPQGLVMDFAI